MRKGVIILVVLLFAVLIVCSSIFASASSPDGLDSKINISKEKNNFFTDFFKKAFGFFNIERKTESSGLNGELASIGLNTQGENNRILCSIPQRTKKIDQECTPANDENKNFQDCEVCLKCDDGTRKCVPYSTAKLFEAPGCGSMNNMGKYGTGYYFNAQPNIITSYKKDGGDKIDINWKENYPICERNENNAECVMKPRIKFGQPCYRSIQCEICTHCLPKSKDDADGKICKNPSSGYWTAPYQCSYRPFEGKCFDGLCYLGNQDKGGECRGVFSPNNNRVTGVECVNYDDKRKI